ncbi:hypothetical protein MMC12_001972 [Toensbergia leucococca]|nr:hypothetical protein [Toensbergia leucococca]
MVDADRHAPLWLCILPSPPSTISLQTLRAAYGPALCDVLRKISRFSNARVIAKLDIAISSPGLSSRMVKSNTSRYIGLQNLLGLLYRLICLVCTDEDIDVQYGNDVNARIFFLSDDTSGDVDNDNASKVDLHLLQGPIVDMRTLALCQRPWVSLCSVESSVGEALLDQFLKIRNASSHKAWQNLVVQRVKGGPEDISPESVKSLDTIPERVDSCHHSVAVGGTFDHLHAGHKLLLSSTALILESDLRDGVPRERSITIGITGDVLLKNKKYIEELQDWDERQVAVRQFMLAILDFESSQYITKSTRKAGGSKPQARVIHDELKSGLVVKYVEIFDPCGPTITDESISALVLSGETRTGGKAVNDERVAKGWSALEIFEVDVLGAHKNHDNNPAQVNQDFQGKISSTDIRQRLHDRLVKMEPSL